jgi:plastocyanin
MSRRLLGAGAILAATTLVACSPVGGGGPPPTLPPGAVAIVAQDLAFTTERLVVPADAAFGLLFENRESAPHNVRIFDEDAAEPLFVGEIFSGPSTRLYDVPALPAGEHSFRCDVHPAMAGEVIAG